MAKKRAIKLGFCALFIVWGLIEYFTKTNGIYDMFAYFLIAAIIINLGGNKNHSPLVLRFTMQQLWLKVQ